MSSSPSSPYNESSGRYFGDSDNSPTSPLYHESEATPSRGRRGVLNLVMGPCKMVSLQLTAQRLARSASKSATTSPPSNMRNGLAAPLTVKCSVYTPAMPSLTRQILVANDFAVATAMLELFATRRIDSKAITPLIRLFSTLNLLPFWFGTILKREAKRSRAHPPPLP